MALSLAKLIRESIDDSSTDVKFRSGYSGRGMYGKRCVGIVGTPADLQAVMSGVGLKLLEHVYDGAMDSEDEDLGECVDAHEEASSVMEELFKYRTDSMGFEQIWYWPNVEDVDENGDMNEVDEDDEDQ